MMDAHELATRLLNRPITPQRLRKLKRLIRSDEHQAQVLAAIEQHESGGPDAREIVERTLPTLAVRPKPPLPKDIQTKLDAFLAKKAAKHA